MKEQPDKHQEIPLNILRKLHKEKAFLKKETRKDAERRRERTRRLVKDMLERMGHITPEAGIDAAKARANAVHAKIDAIVSDADVKAGLPAPLDTIQWARIDDLETLFACRDQLPEWLSERIETIFAKVNWTTSNRTPGYFNKAVHKNNIPIDKALTILSHILGDESQPDWVDAVLECGLFTTIKRGKFAYTSRCQDGEHCELCNFLNISDGLKSLYTAYGPRAFARGGNWFAITVVPRRDSSAAKAVGRTLAEADWDYEKESIVYRESRCTRTFVYSNDTDFDYEEMNDVPMETGIRRFLGAVQFAFGKLVKNGWLDGIRGRVENSIEFLPYASHQHWHAVGSSTCEHDPQRMAEHLKEQVDTILHHTCRGLYANVMVAQIPSAEDLRRWVKYMNKTTNFVSAVESVYNRYPNLNRKDKQFKTLMAELCLVPERSRRVFSMTRIDMPEGLSEKGAHTYTLRRRYVAGNHKFGRGSILTESERHRLWRKRHATSEAARRASA